MKMPLLYALLAAAVLVLPAAAQDGGAKHPDSAGAAPEAAQSAHGGDTAEAAKLPIVLQKGGAVVFQPDAKAKSKMKTKHKYKYKGYTKSKAALEKYRKDGEAKHLDKGAVDSLDVGQKKEAEDLAAQVELNDDVRQTVKAKLEEAKAKDGESEDAQKLDAAQKAAESAKDDLTKQIADFEKSKAKKKVFKDLEAQPGSAEAPGQPK